MQLFQPLAAELIQQAKFNLHVTTKDTVSYITKIANYLPLQLTTCRPAHSAGTYRNLVPLRSYT